MGLEAAAGAGSEFVEDHLPDVVPVLAVLGTRVAEAYDQPVVCHGFILLKAGPALTAGGQ
jgi:hypothetical protein